MLKKISFLGVVFVLMAASFSSASSPEAWEEFRADVKKKTAESVTHLLNPVIGVSDYGTESFGIAVVEGKDKSTNQMDYVVSIYDKRTQNVEFTSIGGILPQTLLKSPVEIQDLSNKITKLSENNLQLKNENQKITAENQKLTKESMVLKIILVFLVLILLLNLFLWRNIKRKKQVAVQ